MNLAVGKPFIRGVASVILVLGGVALAGPLGFALFYILPAAPLPPGLRWVGAIALSINMAIMIAALMLTLAAPVITLSALTSDERGRRSVFPVALAALAWFGSWAGWGIARPVLNGATHTRMECVRRISVRATPIVTALETYRARTGDYPESLNHLVPELLPAVPTTGASGFRHFRYHRSGGGWTFPHGHAPPYELRVETPKGYLNWDCLVYWPTQNYPVRMYGGRVERMGAWAYVHE
jgi:hypothetical protein